jgi:1,4-alpha-glucan branching enzyme
MTRGYVTIVLHNHLPFVIGHGMWPHGMDWLNEAAAETYVPLVEMLERLRGDGIKAGLTMGVTPVLTEQLADERFKQGFDSYLEMKIEAAAENAASFASTGNRRKQALADEWRAFYERVRDDFDNRFGRDIVGRLGSLQDDGCIEIITCAATHGYLPLLGNDECVRAQIMTGVESYRSHYGRDPRGIWLPECAYRPRYAWRPPVDGEGREPVLRAGIEEFLFDAGIKYFFIDSHLLQGGEAIGIYLERFEGLQQLWKQFEKEYAPRELDVTKTPYSIYYASSTGGRKPVAVLTRDPLTTIQVWSGEHGYPGNGYYLDFHKKHFPGGHRYWRVTSAKSDLADKEVYEPGVIDGIIDEQSGHFVELIADLLAEHGKESGKPGLVCSPYDGELFGHWWFEGPRWLEAVLRKLDAHGSLSQVGVSQAMDAVPPHHVVDIPEGSWGEGGFHYIWLNDWTNWTWRLVYEAEEAMLETARGLGERGGFAREVVEQMARELLLLESSDWQFLISTWSARDYAEARVDSHFANFKRLRAIAEQAIKGEEVPETDRAFFEQCMKTNSIFEINLEHWTAPVVLD